MLSLYIALYHLFTGLRSALRDAEFKALFSLAVVMLILGTFFYHNVEGWGWIDSLYFCVVTLATIGYGDLTPQTVAGKLFTIIYILVGVGVLFGFLSALAHHTIQEEEKRPRLLDNAHRLLSQRRRFFSTSPHKEKNE